MLCSCAGQLTELDVPILGEEHVACLQVTVDDLLAMEVMEGFQHLAANHLNLRFGQAPIQLCGEERAVKQGRDWSNAPHEQQEGTCYPVDHLKTTVHVSKSQETNANQLVKVIYSLSQHSAQCLPAWSCWFIDPSQGCLAEASGPGIVDKEHEKGSQARLQQGSEL